MSSSLRSFDLLDAESNHKLAQAAARWQTKTIASCFESEPDRFDRFHLRWKSLLFDFSKNRIDQDVMSNLFALAEEAGLEAARDAMFEGKHINVTEDRAVLHTALRSKRAVQVDGRDVYPDVQAVLDAMERFTQAILSGEFKGFSGKEFTDVVNIGIGGSDLGPVMVCEALESQRKGLTPHFVSNVDGADLDKVLRKVNPETTLFVVVSKTFTTQETLTNAEAARQWLIEHFEDDRAVTQHFAAVSTNLDAVAAFGIDTKRTFGFWNWVGGRYSLWGAVGLSIALSCGWENFEDLLRGAREADDHFREASIEENIPVIMALLGIWYRNYLDMSSHAIIPYSQALHRFPAYLQQADMESNGKSVGRDGNRISHASGPVIWGEPGTNGQHAFFQLLHQGTDVIPVDFIGFSKPTSPYRDHHRKLMANMLAQAEALMTGKSMAEVLSQLQSMSESDRQLLAPYKVFEGNRPSTILLFDELSAKNLGSLIAFYEHKIFVQGIVWNVYSYDQWGVELGKELAKRILPALEGDQSSVFDVSTSSLIEEIKRFVEA